MTRICFIHGWAYTPELWHELAILFPEAEKSFVNLGFFSKPETPSGRFDLVITHSYGLMWLLSHKKIAFEKLVSISGIAAFCKTDILQSGVPQPVLRAMSQQLVGDPKTLLKDFYSACGQNNMAPSDKPDIRALTQALKHMETLDLREQLDGLPLLALAAKEDKIVPAKLTLENFASHHIIWHDSDTHILPKAEAPWCAARIKEFIDA